jgi:hypothetical protein
MGVWGDNWGGGTVNELGAEVGVDRVECEIGYERAGKRGCVGSSTVATG